MKDYNINVHYYPGKTNIVGDALSKMSMGSTTHIEDEKKELVKDVHILARLGVRLVDATSGSVSAHPSSKSSLVVQVKQGHQLDLVLIKLKYSTFKR